MKDLFKNAFSGITIIVEGTIYRTKISRVPDLFTITEGDSYGSKDVYYGSIISYSNNWKKLEVSYLEEIKREGISAELVNEIFGRSKKAFNSFVFSEKGQMV